LYESKGKRIAKERENAIPAGVPQELWVKMKAYQNQLQNEKEAAQLAGSSQLSSGLTVDEQAWITVESKKKKRSKALANQDITQNISQAMKKMEIVNHPKDEAKQSKKTVQQAVPQTGAIAPAEQTDGQSAAVNPKNRLRNLKKKLRDIEALMKVDRKKLGKDQIDKIGRYEEVKKQISNLEIELGLDD